MPSTVSSSAPMSVISGVPANISGSAPATSATARRLRSPTRCAGKLALDQMRAADHADDGLFRAQGRNSVPLRDFYSKCRKFQCSGRREAALPFRLPLSQNLKGAVAIAAVAVNGEIAHRSSPRGSIPAAPSPQNSCGRRWKRPDRGPWKALGRRPKRGRWIERDMFSILAMSCLNWLQDARSRSTRRQCQTSSIADIYELSTWSAQRARRSDRHCRTTPFALAGFARARPSGAPRTEPQVSTKTSRRCARQNVQRIADLLVGGRHRANIRPGRSADHLTSSHLIPIRRGSADFEAIDEMSRPGYFACQDRPQRYGGNVSADEMPRSTAWLRRGLQPAARQPFVRAFMTAPSLSQAEARSGTSHGFACTKQYVLATHLRPSFATERYAIKRQDSPRYVVGAARRRRRRGPAP